MAKKSKYALTPQRQAAVDKAVNECAGKAAVEKLLKSSLNPKYGVYQFFRMSDMKRREGASWRRNQSSQTGCRFRHGEELEAQACSRNEGRRGQKGRTPRQGRREEGGQLSKPEPVKVEVKETTVTVTVVCGKWTFVERRTLRS